MKNKKVTLLNMVSGLVLQALVILGGFIIPRIILVYFGSEMNGLVSTLNQFLSFVSLVEGGITGVIIANLYKPIVDEDKAKISSVLVTAKCFYRRISYIFIAYTLVFAFLHPLIFHVEYSYWCVFFLTLILSVDLLVQYMFSLTLKTLLNASKRGYVVSITQSIIVVLNIVLVCISVKIYPSIHVLKLISGVLFILQPVFFGRYVAKEFDIDWKSHPDTSLVKERWNGFAINIAAFVHNSTDIAILSIMTDMKTVSVYGVYALVVNGIKELIMSGLSGVSHTVGLAYAKGDWDEVNWKLDIYEFIVFILVSFLYTVTALLITSFVMLYTREITDANYNQPIFGLLIVVSEALYLVKLPHLDLSYSANKFKDITWAAFAEAAINIVVSIILVHELGLIGVAVGTILAMLFRLIFHVRFTGKIVEGRSQYRFFGKLLAFALTSIVSYCVCYFEFPLKGLSVQSWLVHGVLYSAITGFFLILLSAVGFRRELVFFFGYLRDRG